MTLADLATEPYEFLYNQIDDSENPIYRLFIFILLIILFYPIGIFWMMPLLLINDVYEIMFRREL